MFFQPCQVYVRSIYSGTTVFVAISSTVNTMREN